MAFSLFQFLHVVTMFGAVATAFLSEVVLHALGRTSDAAGLRGFMHVLRPAGRMIPILFITGAILGFLTAITGGIDLTRPWLLGSYVAFAIAMVTAALVGAPWAQSVGAAAFAAPGSERTPELEAALRDRRGVVASVVELGAIVIIIFFMVVKPGG